MRGKPRITKFTAIILIIAMIPLGGCFNEDYLNMVPLPIVLVLLGAALLLDDPNIPWEEDQVGRFKSGVIEETEVRTYVGLSRPSTVPLETVTEHRGLTGLWKQSDRGVLFLAVE